ncbi:MAG: hypothetical protein R3B07_29175 [Polyangiaceae bacterium]
MGRDSLFGETIVWTGEARYARLPVAYRAVAALAFIATACALSFVLAAKLALHVAALPTLLFAAFSLAVGIAAVELPRWWLSQMRYTVTESHVIWQRGRFRRTIETRSISFARIFWDPRQPGVGDLELVRAVPTGALHRRLTLRLRGVTAPDRVWAIIRGVETTVPAGVGDRPLTQRLDPAERVLWTARPRRSWRALLPRGQRQVGLMFIAVLLLGSAGRILSRLPSLFGSLSGAGIDVAPLVAIGLALTLSLGLLLGLSGYALNEACLKAWRLVSNTRYLVTNRRVLIQRGHEELHLDRDRIVDVIDAPGQAAGVTDLFLVLDGPRARAVEASGAFGEFERTPYLRPVLLAVEDVDGARRVLIQRDELPEAA